MVLDGIYTGIPKKQHKPVADGIVTGLPAHRESMKAHLTSVKGSATQYASGVFGSEPTPQGVGDPKHGAKMHKGMPLAHSHPNAMKKGKMIMKEIHEAMHNA